MGLGKCLRMQSSQSKDVIWLRQPNFPLKDGIYSHLTEESSSFQEGQGEDKWDEKIPCLTYN